MTRKALNVRLVGFESYRSSRTRVIIRCTVALDIVNSLPFTGARTVMGCHWGGIFTSCVLMRLYTSGTPISMSSGANKGMHLI
jgi:hypothetical protein